MEELAVDKRFGFFVNHDLAGYALNIGVSEDELKGVICLTTVRTDCARASLAAYQASSLSW